MKDRQEDFVKNLSEGKSKIAQRDAVNNGIQGKAQLEFLNYQNCGSAGLSNQEWLIDVAYTKNIWDRALRAYLLKDAVTINNKRAEHIKRYCTCGQGEFGRMVGC